MRGGGNMQQMMKQMQKMQKKMGEEQEKLKEEKVQGTAGGGMVTVTVSGHKEVLDVEIKEEAVDPDDIEMLQDLVIAATNEAMNKADELTQERLGKHTQGLNIPGMSLYALSRTNIQTYRQFHETARHWAKDSSTSGVSCIRYERRRCRSIC